MMKSLHNLIWEPFHLCILLKFPINETSLKKILSTSTAIGKRIIGFFLPISSKKCLDHFSISKEPRTILMKKKQDWKAFWSQRLHKEQQILHTNMTIWWLLEDRFEVAQKLVIESMYVICNSKFDLACNNCKTIEGLWGYPELHAS